MTVCVAAICDNDTIFGAADRMLTAGDIQFEPSDIKIFGLTSSIVVMTAGDSTVHSEILQSVKAEIKELLDYDPEEWLNVKDVAEMYGRNYNTVRQKCSERAILAPFGLTTDSFLDRQSQMAPDFVRQLGTEIINYNAGDIEAIITGIDPTGPHIWVVKNEEVVCFDKAGFAAIGAGEWHAKSSFMFARHSRFSALPKTLLLIYAAKRRAEVAPGVGSQTDMFAVGPAIGSFVWVEDHIVASLDEMYLRMRQEESRILQEANTEVSKYVEELAKSATTKEQAAIPKDSGGDSSADQKQLRNGTEESEPKDGDKQPASS